MCSCVLFDLLCDDVCGVRVSLCVVLLFTLFVRFVCSLLRYCTVCGSFACFAVCLCLCVCLGVLCMCVFCLRLIVWCCMVCLFVGCRFVFGESCSC